MNKTDRLINIIYEFTVAFCQLYVASAQEAKSMVCLALTAKKEAKSRYLSELQDKYQDFLDKNDLEAWPEYSLRLRSVRGIAFRPFCTFFMYKPFLSSPERAANAASCLIKQIKFRLGEEKTKSALDYKGASPIQTLRLLDGSGYNKTVEKRMLNYRIIIEPEKSPDGSSVYVAYCPTLGISDYGDSIEDVLESIKDGIKLAIESLAREKKEVPFDDINDQIITSARISVSS